MKTERSKLSSNSDAKKSPQPKLQNLLKFQKEFLNIKNQIRRVEQQNQQELSRIKCQRDRQNPNHSRSQMPTRIDPQHSLFTSFHDTTVQMRSCHSTKTDEQNRRLQTAIGSPSDYLPTCLVHRRTYEEIEPQVEKQIEEQKQKQQRLLSFFIKQQKTIISQHLHRLSNYYLSVLTKFGSRLDAVFIKIQRLDDRYAHLIRHVQKMIGTRNRQNEQVDTSDHRVNTDLLNAQKRQHKFLIKEEAAYLQKMRQKQSENQEIVNRLNLDLVSLKHKNLGLEQLTLYKQNEINKLKGQIMELRAEISQLRKSDRDCSPSNRPQKIVISPITNHNSSKQAKNTRNCSLHRNIIQFCHNSSEQSMMISLLKSTNENLQQKLLKIQLEVQSKEQHRQQSQAKLKNMTEKAQEHSRVILELQKKLSAEIEENKEMERIIEQKEIENRAKLVSLQEAMSQSLSKISGKLTSFNDKIERIYKKHFNTSYCAINDKVKNISEGPLGDNSQQIHQREIDRLYLSIEHCLEEVNLGLQSIKNKQTEMIDIFVQEFGMNKIYCEVSGFREIISQIGHSIRDKDEKIQMLQIEVVSQKNQLRCMRNERLPISVKQPSKSINRSSQIKLYQKQLQNKQLLISKLNEKIENLQIQYHKYVNQYEEKSSILESEIKIQQTTIQELTISNKSLIQSNQQLSAEVQKANLKIKELRNHLEKTSKQSNAMNLESQKCINELRNKLKNVQLKNIQLKENTHMIKQLEQTLREGLNSKNQRIKQLMAKNQQLICQNTVDQQKIGQNSLMMQQVEKSYKVEKNSKGTLVKPSKLFVQTREYSWKIENQKQIDEQNMQHSLVDQRLSNSEALQFNEKLRETVQQLQTKVIQTELQKHRLCRQINNQKSVIASLQKQIRNQSNTLVSALHQSQNAKQQLENDLQRLNQQLLSMQTINTNHTKKQHAIELEQLLNDIRTENKNLKLKLRDKEVKEKQLTKMLETREREYTAQVEMLEREIQQKMESNIQELNVYIEKCKNEKVQLVNDLDEKSDMIRRVEEEHQGQIAVLKEHVQFLQDKLKQIEKNGGNTQHREKDPNYQKNQAQCEQNQEQNKKAEKGGISEKRNKLPLLKMNSPPADSMPEQLTELNSPPSLERYKCRTESSQMSEKSIDDDYAAQMQDEVKQLDEYSILEKRIVVKDEENDEPADTNQKFTLGLNFLDYNGPLDNEEVLDPDDIEDFDAHEVQDI